LELVYLWVEDYKNIHHQGFNFSPRFTCKYEDGKLTIDKKEHVSIFPPNINITAIVGENGSGKSSLFEVLSKILTLNGALEVFNYFYVLNDGLKNICYTNNIEILNTDVTIEKNIPIQVVDGNLSHGTTNHEVALKKHFDVSYLNISHLEREGIIKNNSPSPEDPIKYYGIYRKNDFDLYKENSLYPTFSGFKLSQFNFFQTYAIGNLLVDDKYKKLFFEVFKIKQPYSIKIDYKKEDLEKIKFSNTPNGDPSRLVDASVPEKIDKILEFLIKIYNNLIIESDDYKRFFTLVSSVNLEEEFQLTFQTEENKTIKLSAGEKTILFYLERIDFMLSQFKSKSNILLFDEIELYLHPNWQKRILKIILDFIQENRLMENLHIIIASHSPFILSDLPKENVIFLEKGEQVYPFENRQTFGANIHTLLSHGFFMKDGLMGEFAKGKINQVYNFITQKDTNFVKTKEEAQNIINLIGEPLIKKQLQKLFDETFNKSILTLDDEIALLEKKLNALKELKK
jgi:ABC-type multidrug transport system ATPase subunit